MRGGLGAIESVGTLIIGAGLTGLSTAYHLEAEDREDYLVVERQDRVGGLAGTESFDGFTFDHAIHVLYTADQYIAGLISETLLRDNLRKQMRRSCCYTAGCYTEYPYQANNHGLPVEIITENLVGLIEAHRDRSRNGPPPHFEAWIYQTFGRGIAEHFMIPYNRRQWAWDLRDMSYDWIAERVPMPDLRDVIRGALAPPGVKHGPNREFWYPERGGIAALASALAAAIPAGCLRVATTVERVDGARREVWLSDGRRVRYERLVSTIPLPALVARLEDAPEGVRRAAGRLRYNWVHTVNLGFRGVELGLPRPMHWVYFPQPDTVFHRLSFPHAFSMTMVPPNCTSIQAEISESTVCPRDPTRLVEETLQGLVRVGILRPGEDRPVAAGGCLVVARVVTLDPAYVIYDLDHGANTETVRGYLAARGIESRGRFGEWEYLNMDHAILRGREVATCR